MKVNEVKGFRSFAKEWYGDTGQHEKDSNGYSIFTFSLHVIYCINF